MKYSGVEIAIVLNKMDLPNSKVNYEQNKKLVEKFFTEKKANIISILDGVAVAKPKYVTENKNTVKSILNLIDMTDDDPFRIWELDYKD